LLCEKIFQAFLHVFFIFLPSSLLANSHILRSVRWPPTQNHSVPKRTVTHARDHWWTLDFANAFVFPGVNSRAELVPSPRAYALNGAPHRWLGVVVNEVGTDCLAIACSNFAIENVRKPFNLLTRNSPIQC
jgi:hypothetical protein